MINKYVAVDGMGIGRGNLSIRRNLAPPPTYRLIKDLFTQTLEERRLKRIWPEDLLDDV
jgi:hypothetical protein